MVSPVRGGHMVCVLFVTLLKKLFIQQLRAAMRLEASDDSAPAQRELTTTSPFYLMVYCLLRFHVHRIQTH
jgi:hypothetical protein